MIPSTDMLTVRRAAPREVNLVAGLLAAGFHDGDLAGWLVPDPAERARIYPGYFTILAWHALEHGVVDLAGPRDAVAVWYDHSNAPPPPIAGYDARLAVTVGTHLPRFRALDQAMHDHHPTGRAHHYLALLAVRPDRQRQGLGGALLRHHHTALDVAQHAAYLEATGPRNRLLYLRHGYQSLAPYPIAPDGPRVFPMWRDPAPDLPRPRRPVL